MSEPPSLPAEAPEGFDKNPREEGEKTLQAELQAWHLPLSLTWRPEESTTDSLHSRAMCWHQRCASGWAGHWEEPECGVSSFSDSSLVQLVLLKVYRPLPM